MDSLAQGDNQAQLVKLVHLGNRDLVDRTDRTVNQEVLGREDRLEQLESQDQQEKLDRMGLEDYLD